MLALFVSIETAVVCAVANLAARLARRDQNGQASAEYALVLLGAAAVALLVAAWAARTNRIGRLLDSVVDTVLDRVR